MLYSLHFPSDFVPLLSKWATYVERGKLVRVHHSSFIHSPCCLLFIAFPQRLCPLLSEWATYVERGKLVRVHHSSFIHSPCCLLFIAFPQRLCPPFVRVGYIYVRVIWLASMMYSLLFPRDFVPLFSWRSECIDRCKQRSLRVTRKSGRCSTASSRPTGSSTITATMQAHLDPIRKLERAQQTTVFCLRTGHCGLKAHLKMIGVSDTSLYECGHADQTPPIKPQTTSSMPAPCTQRGVIKHGRTVWTWQPSSSS